MWQVYGIFEKKTGDCIYIGQTRQALRNRWKWHLSWASVFNESPVNIYMRKNGGYENFEICCLKYGYKTKYDALEWESHYIMENEPKCNVRQYR